MVTRATSSLSSRDSAEALFATHFGVVTLALRYKQSYGQNFQQQLKRPLGVGVARRTCNAKVTSSNLVVGILFASFRAFLLVCKLEGRRVDAFLHCQVGRYIST